MGPRPAGTAARRAGRRALRRPVQGRALCHLRQIAGRLQGPARAHPTDENVTVLSGTFHFGMGDKLDVKKAETLKTGGFFRAEKGMQHYA